MNEKLREAIDKVRAYTTGGHFVDIPKADVRIICDAAERCEKAEAERDHLRGAWDALRYVVHHNLGEFYRFSTDQTNAILREIDRLKAEGGL